MDLTSLPSATKDGARLLLPTSATATAIIQNPRTRWLPSCEQTSRKVALAKQKIREIKSERFHAQLLPIVKHVGIGSFASI
jgi:hypothetical protein